MPYKSEKLKIANTKHDRRIKLTDADREQIREDYKNGASMRSLSRKFKVSRALIKCTVDPEEKEKRAEYSKKYSKEHRQSGEERAKVMREYRRHKQEVYLEQQEVEKMSNDKADYQNVDEVVSADDVICTCKHCGDSFAWGDNGYWSGAVMYCCEGCNDDFCTACSLVTENDEKVLCADCKTKLGVN